MKNEMSSQKWRKLEVHVYVNELHCLRCPKNRWSAHLDGSVALKIDKNELEARNIQPFKVGGIVFTKTN
jgi:hypothetical protein